ncbi:PIN domain-containing protein [Thiothrix nivea]|uniref:PIN domain-containing protein n=1 Tax=Thiothrix nivea TaxID=1031 RepID=UPI0012B6AC60|nr:PIN domain-containing protein [Thiothrix nivea]
MSDFTLVDTDILIDAGHQDELAVEVLQNIEATSGLAISSVTQMELVVGCRNKTELRELAKFLRRFQVIHLSKKAQYAFQGLIPTAAKARTVRQLAPVS